MCRFTIEYQGRPFAIMERAKEMIEKDGGSFRASETLAVFSVNTPLGPVDGKCVLGDSSTIDVTITKKPRLVPCSVVKQRMHAAFVVASKASETEPETDV